MTSSPLRDDLYSSDDQPPSRQIRKVILRLVKDSEERRALEAGEVDAVVDPASGQAILLPEARRFLSERRENQGTPESAPTWNWHQDENHCFISVTPANAGGPMFTDHELLGRALWELPFETTGEIDWKTHQQQRAWHCRFDDLEIRHVNAAGRERHLRISGEPVFDAQDVFRGYSGTLRDVTRRSQRRQNRNTSGADAPALAVMVLDALDTQVCVIDASGRVLLSNPAWQAFAKANPDLGTVLCDGPPHNGLTTRKIIDAGIRSVLSGQVPRFDHLHAARISTQSGWFALSARRLDQAGDMRVLLSREDCTIQQRLERDLDRSESQLRVFVDGDMG